MRAARIAAAALLIAVVSALPAAAAPSPTPAPSASPEDRATTATVTPAAAPDRSAIVLRGFSDCAVIDAHLLFTTYDGQTDNVVVRRTSTTYDYGREKYPFAIRLTVPASAAPGAAKVYAEPFCGPPDEYPASRVLPFRVERSTLSLRLSPQRAAAGERLRIEARTCDGASGVVTVRIGSGGATRDLRAPVAGTGAASVSVEVSAAGEVSLPHAATECRGSSYAGAVRYDVRGAVARTDRASPTQAPTRAAATASPSSSPSPVPATTPSAAGPAGRTADTGGGHGRVLVAAAVAVAVSAAGLGVVLLRRRPTA